IDGIGHGEEAANAAEAAISILKASPDEPVISLLERCHEGLRSTRGVVLSLASIDPKHGMMTWVGVGNVQGVLMRAGAKRGEWRRCCCCAAASSARNCLPCKPLCCRLQRGILWF